MRLLSRAVLVLVVASATLAIGQGVEPEAKASEEQHVAKASTPVSTYRLDYEIHEVEGGKHINTHAYTTRVADNNQRAALRTGSRVPITTGEKSGENAQFQYVDVGVRIDANLTTKGKSLYLWTSIDISGVAPDQAGQSAHPVIRSNHADANSTVTLGKTMLLASIDDAVSKRRYEVEVKVTQE